MNLSKAVVALLILLIGFSPLALSPGFSFQKNEAKAITITVYVTGGKLDFIASIPSLEALARTIAAATTNVAAQQKLEYIEEFALATLKRQLLNRISDDIINWINGGGEPRFVTDWEGFLNDAVGLATGAVIQELGFGFLCSPFSTQLQLNVAASQRRDFRSAITCTLDDIVKNIENFYYNFESGGWIGFYEAWQPQNNFFGSYLITQEELNRRAASASKAAQNEALAGGGVLSTKSCEERGDTSNPASGPDIDGDKKYGDFNCKITTPGSIVQGLLEKVLSIDIDLILQSEQLPDYVANIANALINRIIREGVNGLRGLTSSSNPGNDFVPPNPIATPCDGLEGDLLQACLSYQGIINVSFENSRQALLDSIAAALVERRATLEILENTKLLWEQHLQNLEGKEDSCTSAESFIDTTAGKIATLEFGIQIESQSITELEASQEEIEEITFNAWDQLVDMQIELAGIANAEAAKNSKERVASEQQIAQDEIDSQENICGIGGSGGSGSFNNN
ncbi:MAG: hypothetical protein Q8Q32_02525 [bacterium]|nr:hypothetical protein [bacterium]